MPIVTITLTNHNTDYDLVFDLLDIPIAHRWLKEVKLFIKAGFPWDDAERFYNFPNSIWTKDRVIAKINQYIDTINNYSPGLVATRLNDDVTQDQLNYLHSIFEQYHGLYDQQSSNEFFSNSPYEVQSALGDLNIWIHRYESLGGIPRFVATWRGKPSRQPILDSDFDHFTLEESWGDLRLNYCEIGKHLYDLWHDNDVYVSAEAFKPQHWFAFDFTVRFTTYSLEHYQNEEQQIWEYFDRNQLEFKKLGYAAHDPKLALGSITIARLRKPTDQSTILNQIDLHQHLKSIHIS